MEFQWNPDKNIVLQRERGVSFEEILAAIEVGGLLANQPHPNHERYPQQRVLVVAINDYAYIVPYIVRGDVYELITIFPSRKATRDYLRSPNP